MAQGKQLQVCLGDLNKTTNVHESMSVHGMGDLKISFHREIRVPEYYGTTEFPSKLGQFPIYPVTKYESILSKEVADKGGVFITMNQQQAMRINFTATRPFVVKVYVGGVNAVSGQPKIQTLTSILREVKLLENKKKENAQLTRFNCGGLPEIDEDGLTSPLQDYVVVSQGFKDQPSLNGVATGDGEFKQFVAMAAGYGYSVEAPFISEESVLGLQFEIIPSKQPGAWEIEILVKTLTGKTFVFVCDADESVFSLKCKLRDDEGIPLNQQRLIFKGAQMQDGYALSDYSIENGSTVHLVMRLSGGGPFLTRAERAAIAAANAEVVKEYIKKQETTEFFIAPEDPIQQTIRRDRFPADTWAKDKVIRFDVGVLNTASFQRLRGLSAPKYLLPTAACTSQRIPILRVSENRSRISGSFGNPNSRATIQKQKTDESENAKFCAVKLNTNGIWPEFKCAAEKEEEILGMNFATIE